MCLPLRSFDCQYPDNGMSCQTICFCSSSFFIFRWFLGCRFQSAIRLELVIKCKICGSSRSLTFPPHFLCSSLNLSLSRSLILNYADASKECVVRWLGASKHLVEPFNHEFFMHTRDEVLRWTSEKKRRWNKSQITSGIFYWCFLKCNCCKKKRRLFLQYVICFSSINKFFLHHTSKWMNVLSLCLGRSS